MQSMDKDLKKSQFPPINCHYCTPFGRVKGKLDIEVVNSSLCVLMFIPKEKDAKNQEVYKSIDGKYQ
jgi:hypothetical protein